MINTACFGRQILPPNNSLLLAPIPQPQSSISHCEMNTTFQNDFTNFHSLGEVMDNDMDNKIKLNAHLT